MAGGVAAAIAARGPGGGGGEGSTMGNIFGEKLTETMQSFDTDDDGVLSKAERKLLLKSRGSVRARLVSLFDVNKDEEIDAEEMAMAGRTEKLFDRVYVLDALSKKYATAHERRGQYRGILSHLLYMVVLFVMLVLQMRPSEIYEVTDILSTLLPKDAGSGESTDRLSGVSEVYDWIGAFVGPAWKDPRCGDGVCEAPIEFPGFGRFGCAPDCGVAKNLTTLEVEVESHFIENAMVDPGAITEFLSITSWNLCSPSHKVEEQEICWWATNKKFTSSKEKIVDKIDVPDGDWRIQVSAPFGRASVSGGKFELY